MNSLPKSTRKKINKKEFIKLAKKVKKTFEQENIFLEKRKNDEDYYSSRLYFCN